MPQDKLTKFGKFTRDASGLWHYHVRRKMPLSEAIVDALSGLPDGPAWFWHYETPVPIHLNDTAYALNERYFEWQHCSVNGNVLLHDKLCRLTGK